MTDPGPRVRSRPPTISVVIPAYNAERTLVATLDSVCAQTLSDFEAIVVDDGSFDGTRVIAESYAARDPRFRVVSQSNRGVADARNAGVRRARAPLVAPLDADDVWHATYLEKLHEALVAAGPETLFAFAGFRKIDLEGEVLKTGPLFDVQGTVFHRLLLQNLIGNGSGMVFRREAALAVGGYERRLQYEFEAHGCEDILLQLRLAARGRVVAVPEYLVGYRSVPGGMSSDRLRMFRSRVHAVEILSDEVGIRETRAVRWVLGSAKAQCAIRGVLAGQVVDALRWLREALIMDPVGTLETIAAWTLRRLIRPLRPIRAKGPFDGFDTREGARYVRRGLLKWRLKRMGEVDRGVRALPEVTAD